MRMKLHGDQKLIIMMTCLHSQCKHSERAVSEPLTRLDNRRRVIILSLISNKHRENVEIENGDYDMKTP